MSNREFNDKQKTTFLTKILFILQHNLLLARYTWSNDLSTFRCISCNTTSQGLQSSHRFPIWPLNLMKISVSGAISLSLGTDKSHWGLDLENKVGGEENRIVVHWFLLSFISIYELVYCLVKSCLFSWTNGAVFLWSLFSIGPIMHSNSHFWFFSFFQIVGEEYVTWIPKYRSHNFSSRLLCLWSLWCLFFRFWCVVVDSCFINGHKSARISY